MTDDNIDKELEKMLALERDEDARVATLQSQVTMLMEQVQALTQQAAQVRSSTSIVQKEVQALQSLPERLQESLWSGNNTRATEKNREEVTKLISELLSSSCELINKEVSKMDQLIVQILQWKDYSWKQIIAEQKEFYAQAQHDDQCMRELARLLQVASTEVVNAVKNCFVKRSGGDTTRVNSRNYTRNAQAYELPDDYDKPLFQREQPMEFDSPGTDTATDFRKAIEQVREGRHTHTAELASFNLADAERGQFYSINTNSYKNCTPVSQENNFKIANDIALQPLECRNKPTTAAPTQISQGVFPSQFQPELNVGATLAAMALPEVPLFSHPQGKGFENFVTSFYMKYGRLGLQDNMLIHLMCSKLQGYPRAVMETLPRNDRESSYANFVEALRAKLKENDVARRTEAYIKLKQLRKRSSVTDYCVELEELTQRVYQDASDKELSMIRAGELITQLTEWKEYIQLFSTLEQSRQEEAYEKLKSLAQCIERSRQVANAVRFCNKTKYDNRPTARQFENEEKVVSERDCWKAQACQKKKEQPLEQAPPPSKSEPVKVHPSSHGQRKETTEAQMFTTTLSRWNCKEIQAKSSAYSELFGKQTIAKVDLLGMSKLALLDTGSQISIMPLSILLEAQQAGFDIDSDVEEVPVPNKKAIYDASGNEMDFKGAIRLTVKTKNIPSQKVAMFVRKSDDNMIVFGTNALKQFNLALKGNHSRQKVIQSKKSQTPQQSHKNKEEGRKTDEIDARPAVVVRRVYIPPGETKSVAISIPEINQDQILWSDCDVIPDTVCHYSRPVVEIPVTNTLHQAKIFRVGEKVGNWDTETVVEQPAAEYTNMLERTCSDVVERERHLLELLCHGKRSIESEEPLRKLVT
ncbi:hypothetical protein COOONC_20394, partial [Cooperia oncophora]